VKLYTFYGKNNVELQLVMDLQNRIQSCEKLKHLLSIIICRFTLAWNGGAWQDLAMDQKARSRGNEVFNCVS